MINLNIQGIIERVEKMVYNKILNH